MALVQKSIENCARVKEAVRVYSIESLLRGAELGWDPNIIDDFDFSLLD